MRKLLLIVPLAAAAIFVIWLTGTASRVDTDQAVAVVGDSPITMDEFGAEYLDDPSLGKPADPQCFVQRKRTAGNDGHGGNGVRSQAHDGTFTKLALDLGHGRFDRFIFIRRCRHTFLLVHPGLWVAGSVKNPMAVVSYP